jgi:hypothetical protein|tara:strand:- start:120 stop:314 length:195 start_codon:yes stop_codon:yes gene_type:complete
MNPKLTQKKKQCLQIQSKGQGQDLLMLILGTKQKSKTLLLWVGLGPPTTRGPGAYALDNRMKPD